MSGPRGNNYHVNWGRVNREGMGTGSAGLLPASSHFLGVTPASLGYTGTATYVGKVSSGATPSELLAKKQLW